ncbi:hypothetical protein H8B02_28490 [Bradyrhizobium sp. Pear77]|uniref:hypothetical protein n=1 Tax=Bradyrhizobium altum TaxID=1571202 RepID=UPI0035DA2209|nr:hypothetical protein [Bradyrhizobium altum]
MRISTLTALVAVAAFGYPAAAQQASPGQNLQSEADKGAKTQNSGASGYVGDQERPGAAAHPPGEPGVTTGASSTTAPSAQNSGTGISGSPGNKNGAAAQKGTVGSSQQNLSVQEQDPSNIKGLPGGKSGAATKQSPR